MVGWIGYSTSSIGYNIHPMIMNTKLETGNNNLTCLFTERDWEEWYSINERQEKKEKIIEMTPAEKELIRKNRYNKRWMYGCNLCDSKSDSVRGLKYHYKYIHKIHTTGDDIKEHNTIHWENIRAHNNLY